MQSMGIATHQNAAPLDAVEAAKILHMNSRTLVRWARCGYVPAHPLGEGRRRIWRFFESELVEWVERQQNRCSEGVPQGTIPIAIGAHAKKEIA
jgi:Helix-turn-helix domain